MASTGGLVAWSDSGLHERACQEAGPALSGVTLEATRKLLEFASYEEGDQEHI